MNSANRRSYHDKDRSSDRHNEDRAKTDVPPYSRVFIVCGKNITEEEFRQTFEPYGTIEEVWVLKDRGIAYIKFSKTSEAALAVESLNGRCLEPHPRPLKVMIANSRGQNSGKDITETERCRLFLVVPKTMTEDELKHIFREYGDVDYVSLVKDRSTSEPKGFAYVKYHRMSQAAKAFEDCDRAFKPVFADPKPVKSNSYDIGGGHTGPGSTVSSSSMSAYDMISLMDSAVNNPDACCQLVVSAAPSLNQDQVWRLFDIVPGLDYCERKNSNSRMHQSKSPQDKSLFTVVYNNTQSTAYAKEKLHGFEYPPGHRLVVKYDGQGYGDFGRSMHPPSGRSHGGHGNVATSQIKTPFELAQFSETIANATAFLQAAGFNQGTSPAKSGLGNTHQIPPGDSYDPSYCSVQLPAPQPLASIDSPVAERLFVVCSPTPPPMYALKDVFGRFGNLIDIFILKGKTCGYAKYSDKESADKAVAMLHGQEVCGIRLKVMTADPHGSKNSSDPAARKRQKVDS